MARTPPSTETMRLMELAAQYIRQPTGSYDEDGVGFVEFDPPLTTQEQATFDTLRALVHSGMTGVTPTDYATIRTNLQILRDLRQLGRNPFMALTAADRDRMIYDALVADTVIWLAVLRE